MSRNTYHQFVETDGEHIVNSLIKAYENITGRTVHPASPDRLFISWVASIILSERVNQNYTANQNLPSRAEGENLDALGEWIYNIKRLAAQPSKCTVRFTLSTPQGEATIIPRGTRVTDASKTLVWYTTKEAEIKAGDTYTDQTVQCEIAGASGNGFVAGQINKLIDVDNIPYFSSCRNIETSNGGSEEATDDEYYELMRAGLDSYSTAGPKGAYEYYAKSVSTEIADVAVVTPKEQITYTLDICVSHKNRKAVFLAAERIVDNSVAVYKHGSTIPAKAGIDYTCTVSDSLLTIEINDSGSLYGETEIDVTAERIMAGYIDIYALMNNGTAADSVIKSAILESCSDDSVRPLTDYVRCLDAECVDYDIAFTYYIKRGESKSINDIQRDVKLAVDEFVKWQHSKIGRDINPSELNWRLKDTGIKRAVITAPSFIPLRSGEDHLTPQYARLRSVDIVNGGFENE